MSKKYLSISCDGGGLRGLISSLLLQDLAKKTNQDLFQRVNYYTGTSIGTLTSCALASGVSIDKVVEFYSSMQICETIFPPLGSDSEKSELDSSPNLNSPTNKEIAPESTRNEDPYTQFRLQKYIHDKDSFSREKSSSTTTITDLLKRKAKDDLPSIPEKDQDKLDLLSEVWDLLWEPVYTSEGRLEAVEWLLPEGVQLGELEKQVLAATFQLRNKEGIWQPTAIHNLPNLEPQFEDFSSATLVETAMCSSAVPLFYPPYQIAGFDYNFIDGAMFANNPCTFAITALQASGILQEQAIPMKNVYMLSVGTGFNQNSYPYHLRDNPILAKFPYGLVGWLWPKNTETVTQFPLAQALVDGISDIDTFQARMILGENNFHRANINLGSQALSFNDCSQIGTITQVTQEYMETEEWANTVQWVQKNFF